MKIKAIDTEYKGYSFRSRLEARWAVFFESMGIEWDYENEGFETDAGWYLPDFFLPSHRTVIEIKPRRKDWPRRGWIKDYSSELLPCITKINLVAKGLGWKGLVVFGRPWPGEYFVYSDDFRLPHYSMFSMGGQSEDRMCLSGVFLSHGEDKFLDTGECANSTCVDYLSSQMMDSYRMASGARFEHGSNISRRRHQ